MKNTCQKFEICVQLFAFKNCNDNIFVQQPFIIEIL